MPATGLLEQTDPPQPTRQQSDSEKLDHVNEKIRVMRIFSRLNIGGPSIHVVLLTQQLDSSRYETTLVVGREGDREGSFDALARSKNVSPLTIETMGRSIRAFADLRSFVSLCRLMLRDRPHVVHTHTAKAGALGRLAAFTTGVPVVVHTFHGTVFTGYFGPVGSRVYSVVERALARITDAVIGVSPAVTAELVKHRLRPRHEIRTVPLGLELDRFLDEHPRGGFRRRLGLPKEAKLIGCVGRLVPIKDLPTLLAAFADVDGAHLALIGDGPERERLESLGRELGLDRRIHFTGFLSNLEEVYQDLDIVVNSSRNEGTPVSLIEAMAAGVPVVATSVGGTPDLLQNGNLGELVPAGEPKSLSEALTSAIERPEPGRARCARARAAVLAKYRSERLVSDIEVLYRDLLRKNGVAAGVPELAPDRT